MWGGDLESYELKLIRSKVEGIQKLINLPIYTIIQGLPDHYFEDYYRKEPDSLECGIRYLKWKLKKYELLKCQINLEPFRAVYRCKDYERGKKLTIRIDDKIQELNKQLELLQTKTATEIKETFLDKLPERETIEQVLSKLFASPLDASEKILLSVGDDAKKAQQMAGLLAEYWYLSNKEVSVPLSISTSRELPSSVKELVVPRLYYGEESYTYDAEGYTAGVEYAMHFTDMDHLSERFRRLNEWERKFYQVGKELVNECTPEKVADYVQYNDFDKCAIPDEMNEYLDTVSIDDLKRHEQKLGVDDFQRLKELIILRDSIKRNPFKRRNVDEIKAIRKQLQKYIWDIKDWYVSRFRILEKDEDIDRLTQHDLTEYIYRCFKLVGEVREILYKTKVEIEKQQQVVEEEKAELVQQIKALSGLENLDTVPLYSKDSTIVLDHIFEANIKNYFVSLIKQVQQVAKQQDVKTIFNNYAILNGIFSECDHVNEELLLDPLDEKFILNSINKELVLNLDDEVKEEKTK